ncbi:dihydrolipoyl dehydrogenase [Flavobacteriaceae bacterium]|nr:dihydrolipoyl dehydrogenase [Flavobacteriaceae bacterium]
MTIKNFDICIIGAGPGGYVTAIRAAQLGLKVGIIEANHLGGICLNWGCIPTKALLRSGEVHHIIKNSAQFGFEVPEVKFDFSQIIQRSRNVAKQLSSGISHLMKKNKIEVIDGFAKLENSTEISVHKNKDGEKTSTVKAKEIVIATGARARKIPNIDFANKNIWTYREAMTPKKLPKSIIVIGSGAIGVEFASFYRNMGSEVTIVEMAQNILPVEDEEISKLAHKSFSKQGIKIHTESILKTIKDQDNQMEVIIEQKGKTQIIKAEKVIMAVGIVPNTENIGLEKAQVELNEKGLIKTNEFLQTSQKNIWAIGDVVAGPWLAHKASHEGVITAEKIAEKLGKFDAKNTHPIKTTNIPGCTYSMPQIASVGITEKKAKELGLEIEIGRFPYMANGKAIAMGETEGLIKTIFDKKTGELLGAHLIGAEVTEMIQGYVIGKQAELINLDFSHTIFPHPTMSEMMHESVLDASSRSLHF